MNMKQGKNGAGMNAPRSFWETLEFRRRPALLKIRGEEKPGRKCENGSHFDLGDDAYGYRSPFEAETMRDRMEESMR